jgi:hypothetical protein
MPLQNLQALSSINVPEADRVVVAATGQDFPIRAEDHRPDPSGVPLQRFDTLLRAQIPELNGLIEASTGEQRANT